MCVCVCVCERESKRDDVILTPLMPDGDPHTGNQKAVKGHRGQSGEKVDPGLTETI